MVVQRTIDNLRERPEHERAAIASSIAIGVVILLFVGWFALFVHGLGDGQQAQAPAPAATTPSGKSTVQPAAPATLEWDATAASTAPASSTSQGAVPTYPTAQ